jgi:hypothetical protein
VKVPILIACFSRPQHLARVISALQGIENPIYFAIDGPRNSSDLKAIRAINEIIEGSNLNVAHIKNNSVNIGTNNVALALDWVFQTNDSVIVIEEDVLISTQFIFFAEQMLSEFKSDFRVGSIAAMNSVPSGIITNPSDPYYFSEYFYAWGWATWKSRWDMKIPVSDWKISTLKYPKSARHPLVSRKWRKRFRSVEAGESPGLWDYRWIYTYWMNGWLTVVPTSNLAINIGFDSSASHTKIQPSWAPALLQNSQEDNWGAAVRIQVDKAADEWSSKFVHNAAVSIIMKTQIKESIRKLGLIR